MPLRMLELTIERNVLITAFKHLGLVKAIVMVSLNLALSMNSIVHRLEYLPKFIKFPRNRVRTRTTSSKCWETPTSPVSSWQGDDCPRYCIKSSCTRIIPAGLTVHHCCCHHTETVSPMAHFCCLHTTTDALSRWWKGPHILRSGSDPTVWPWMGHLPGLTFNSCHHRKKL